MGVHFGNKEVAVSFVPKVKDTFRDWICGKPMEITDEFLYFIVNNWPQGVRLNAPRLEGIDTPEITFPADLKYLPRLYSVFNFSGNTFTLNIPGELGLTRLNDPYGWSVDTQNMYMILNDDQGDGAYRNLRTLGSNDTLVVNYTSLPHGCIRIQNDTPSYKTIYNVPCNFTDVLTNDIYIGSRYVCEDYNFTVNFNDISFTCEYYGETAPIVDLTIPNTYSFPESYRKLGIGSHGWQSPGALFNLTYEAGITQINDNNSVGLAVNSITIPEGVTSISTPYMWIAGKNDKTIELPESLTEIKYNTFKIWYVDNFEPPSVTIICKAKTPPTLASGCFKQGSSYRTVVKVKVPAESVDAYKAATNWSAMTIEPIIDDITDSPLVGY